jgi:hypothetical protein
MVDKIDEKGTLASRWQRKHFVTQKALVEKSI